MFPRLALLLPLLALCGCVFRPRPLVRVTPAAHVHSAHCGHSGHGARVIVVR